MADRLFGGAPENQYCLRLEREDERRQEFSPTQKSAAGKSAGSIANCVIRRSRILILWCRRTTTKTANERSFFLAPDK